ncbi:MAG: aminotransferase class V-fold PLP-dependent enzyme [Bacteroidia bacterium]
MSNRRAFLKQTVAAAGTFSLLELTHPVFAAEIKNQVKRISGLPPDEAARDEDFWSYIRECFTVNPNLINLNNGGVSPQPKVVQDAHIRYYQYCNEGPSYYMWRILDQGREPLRAKLADMAGCSPDEVAINRNSTEGLNTIIFGLNLKAGDEVVLCHYDYPNMMNAWRQREAREGIKLTWLDFDFPVEDDHAIVEAYEKAITPKTKIVHVTHLINWVGQIMPVKKIADMAHAKGCEVIVDGAHTFSHLDFKVPDLGGDYFATSLHKWACCPFGSGMMYVKKDKIKNVWALLSNDKPAGDDIRKFESIGTRSFASEMAISSAIDFNLMIGIKRKEARLRFLKNYWTEKVKSLPNVKFSSSLKPEWSCAIALLSIDGWKSSEIESWLLDKKKIHCTTIEYRKLNGVRITPHVYTSLKDLDKLVQGVQEMSAMLPPARKTSEK